jgi:hypothetical protein
MTWSRRSATLGLVATLGLTPAPVGAQCPGWDEMLAGGTLVQIEAKIRGEIDLTLSIVYLNRPDGGRCTLGETLYDGLETNLLSAGLHVQAFWVGVSGRSSAEFVPEKLFVVQGDAEMALALKGALDLDTRLGPQAELDTELLVFYEAELDRNRPIRLIYLSEIGPVSAAYLLRADAP